MSTISIIDSSAANMHPQLSKVESRMQSILAELPGLDFTNDKSLRMANPAFEYIFAQLVLWSADLGAGPTEMSIDLAAAVELIYLSNEAAASKETIPFGNYLLCQGFTLASHYSPNVVEALLETTTDLLKGMINEQWIHANPLDSQDQYLERLYHKMAGYTAICCKLGALSTEAAQSFIETITSFGFALGMALQIRIDFLHAIEKEAQNCRLFPASNRRIRRTNVEKKQVEQIWETFAGYISKADACLSSLPQSIAKQELYHLLHLIEMTPCFN